MTSHEDGTAMITIELRTADGRVLGHRTSYRPVEAGSLEEATGVAELMDQMEYELIKKAYPDVPSE